jgi:hypothetical protein
MFKIKADPKLPYHYIIGVSMHNLRSSRAGEVYLKYGPVYFSHKDIVKVQDTALLSADKVFKTTTKEAADMFKCRALIISLNGLMLAASVNNITLHHFSCELEVPDYWNWFELFVNNSNKCESEKRKLIDARIKGY